MQVKFGDPYKAKFCVIVGDIVDSKSIKPAERERVLQASKEIFAYINEKYRLAIFAEFGPVRGDAFEGVLLAKYKAPYIVPDLIRLFSEAGNTYVRIAVAIDELTAVSLDRNECDGPAFHRAMSNLSNLKGSGWRSNYWLQVSFDGDRLGSASLMNSQMGLLGALTSGWTKRQREVVWTMERFEKSRARVAEELGISQSVLSKQLKASNYVEYGFAWYALYFYLAFDYDITDSDYSNYLTNYDDALWHCEHKKYASSIEHFEKALECATQDFGEGDVRLTPFINALEEAKKAKAASEKETPLDTE